VKWAYKKTVHIHSTKHKKPEFVEIKKSEGKRKLKPNCGAKYNSPMDGVDTHDQHLVSHPLM
jgi:hypothetical protein